MGLIQILKSTELLLYHVLLRLRSDKHTKVKFPPNENISNLIHYYHFT